MLNTAQPSKTNKQTNKQTKTKIIQELRHLSVMCSIKPRIKPSVLHETQNLISTKSLTHVCAVIVPLI